MSQSTAVSLACAGSAQIAVPCAHALQGALTPKLLCCQSGQIDGCGVCDGDGASCPTQATVTFADTNPAPARRLTAAPSDPGRSLFRGSGRALQQISAGTEDAVERFRLCMCTPPLRPKRLVPLCAPVSLRTHAPPIRLLSAPLHVHGAAPPRTHAPARARCRRAPWSRALAAATAAPAARTAQQLGATCRPW